LCDARTVIKIVDCIWIRKELDLAIGRVVNRGSQNTQISGQHRGNSVGSVEDECSWPRSGSQAEWQSATRSEDAGNLPATDERIHPTTCVTAKHLSTNERQFPDSIHIHQVTNVEIRVTAANAKVSRIANKTARRNRVCYG